MRQAIVTKYLGPTDHRGSRIMCKAQAGRMMVPWDHSLDVGGNHRRAAMAFVAKWGWGELNEWHGGALPDGSGYCFVRFEG